VPHYIAATPNPKAALALVRKLEEDGFANLLTRNRAELDLRNASDVDRFFAQEKPAVVILAAAKVGACGSDAGPKRSSPIEAALHNLGRRVPLIDLKFFVTGLILQRQTGANMVQVLENLALEAGVAIQARGQRSVADAAQPSAQRIEVVVVAEKTRNHHHSVSVTACNANARENRIGHQASVLGGRLKRLDGQADYRGRAECAQNEFQDLDGRNRSSFDSRKAGLSVICALRTRGRWRPRVHRNS